MGDGTDNPKQDARGDWPSRRTELIRAAADGELSPAGERELREHLSAHPDDASVVEFEKELRRAIASSVQSAPSRTLRERIAGLSQETAAAAVRQSDGGPLPLAPEIGRSASAWRGWIRGLAIAACLALVAGVAYFGAQRVALTGSGGPQAATSYRLSLAAFVSSHHEECELHTEMAMREYRFTRLDRAPEFLAGVLGSAPDLGTLSRSGLTFVGGGPCAVPGRGRSVHLVFEAGAPEATPSRTPMVSVFVQRDAGELDIPSGQTYRIEPRDSGTPASPADIYVWKRDGFVYFLASTSDTAIETARMALGAGAPVGTL